MADLKPVRGSRFTGLGGELLAEFVGTFILILIGNGAIAVAVANGSYALGAVAVMWFIAVTLGVYAAGAISGAHINPAVTLAFATVTDFPWRKVPAYIATQVVSAFTASAVIYLGYAGVIRAYEQAEGLTRGDAGSEASAMIFATYAPNPAEIGTDAASHALVSHVQWFGLEFLMTGLLVFGILYIVDEVNTERPLSNVGPAVIGMIVGALVAFGAPLTMTAINPARDLGPRLFAWLAGWGHVAFPGPRGGFWIPLVATSLGGVVAGLFYQFVYKRAFPKPAPPGRVTPETQQRQALGA